MYARVLPRVKASLFFLRHYAIFKKLEIELMTPMENEERSVTTEESPNLTKDQYLKKDLRFIFIAAALFLLLIFGMWWYDSTQGIFQSAGGSLLDFLM